MGKTHEALLRAEKEYQKNLPQVLAESQKSIIGDIPKRKIIQYGPKSYEELKTKIQIQYHEGALKSIMFTGTDHGDGTSTNAIGFASYLAGVHQLKVLLMDVNLRTPCIHKFFDINQTRCLRDIFLNLKFDDLYVSKSKDIACRNLHVMTCCNGSIPESVGFFESDRFIDFLHMMHKKFDYIIMDASPVLLFLESKIISPMVDGVVLILKSGKTRRHVALKAKEELEMAGANFLGAVLNKRKYYIPKWIYRKL